MKALFVAGFGPIVSDVQASEAFYGEALGLPLQKEGGYLHTDAMEGVKHFALWPLEQAAESCFGVPHWPTDVPTPQAWMEVDVEDLASATRELEDRGYRVLVSAREEPWGQIVTRLLSPEGILFGITHTPWMREASSAG